MYCFIHVFFFQVNFFPSQCLLVTSTVRMVHSKAPHAAQLEMWVSSVVKSLAFICDNDKTKPTKMPLNMDSHSKVQQSTLPHHTLCTVAIRPFAAFLRNLPLLFLLSWQTADWPQKQEPNYTHICHGRPDWHSNLSVLVCQWKRFSRIWPPKL